MLKKNLLGSTGISVSALGLGTVKFGRNQQVKYPDAFTLPDDKTIIELLNLAQELGINLLDTAPAYGTSEERLGRLLPGKRDAWVISTKIGEEFVDGVSHFDFSALAIRRSIERSLTRLNTDFLDIVLVHSNGDDEQIINDFAVFDTLSEIKRAGLIRAFGMSTKTIAGGLLALAHSDIVMANYNPVQTEELPILTYAQQHHKGIFIKKALLSGHLQQLAGTDPVLTSMQFIFSQPSVSSVIIGTINNEHLRHNINCAQQALGA